MFYLMGKKKRKHSKGLNIRTVYTCCLVDFVSRKLSMSINLAFSLILFYANSQVIGKDNYTGS